jgi:6-phosphogluconate dehydrogenase
VDRPLRARQRRARHAHRRSGLRPLISSLKDERVAASAVLAGPADAKFTGDVRQTIEDIRQALYASKIISYAQGYMLMRQVSEQYKWKLNFGGIALMWRGGCIIRSRFLGDIKAAFDRNPNLTNLVLDPFFTDALKKPRTAGGAPSPSAPRSASPPRPSPTPWPSTIPTARPAARQPAPGPARLLRRPHLRAHRQAARQFFHTNWTGQGGTT